MRRKRRRKENRGNKLGVLAITVVALLLLCALFVQTAQLKEKEAVYLQQKEDLQTQLDAEEDRTAELEQYRMPEELSDDMDALRAAVADVAMEEVITKSHAMVEHLQNKGE